MECSTEIFNRRSRTENAAKSSFASLLCSISNIGLSFLYRTVFIHVLGVTYLGLDGLFTGILSALSLAELGVTTAITFRFYAPIERGDIASVGRLMVFFKWVYRLIAATITICGLILIPYLPIFIADANEVPDGVNTTVIYLLFLLQSVSSYFYSYKLTILNADQRGYTYSIIQLLVSICKYVLPAIMLTVFPSYLAALITSICSVISVNYLASLWVHHQYEPVFQVKEMLEKQKRQLIYKDVYATFCHKIGSVVLTATDSIVLSSSIGIIVTGIYSNYALIINGLNSLLDKMFTSFVGSLGNAHVALKGDERYRVYLRLIFLNSWISSFVTVCIWTLIDDFISLWAGNNMLLGKPTVACICIVFFLQSNRAINGAFTSGTGLFVKDRARPFIEAIVKVVFSILLVRVFGITGVFLGTVLSVGITTFWREPYILHKYEFVRSSVPYWRNFALFAVLTVGICCLFSLLKIAFSLPLSWSMWIFEAIICVVLHTILLSILLFRTNGFRFFLGAARNKLFHDKME